MKEFLVSQQYHSRNTCTRCNPQISQDRKYTQQECEHCGNKAGGTQTVLALTLTPHEGSEGYSNGGKSSGEKDTISVERQGAEYSSHQSNERKSTKTCGTVALLRIPFTPAAFKAD
jgi:hypothetical protein